MSDTPVLQNRFPRSSLQDKQNLMALSLSGHYRRTALVTACHRRQKGRIKQLQVKPSGLTVSQFDLTLLFAEYFPASCARP
jgi:hypothetical protein